MRYYKNKKIIVLFLLPALIFLILFMYYPFFMSFYKSFFHSDGFFQSEFIGLGNYKRLIEDEMIYKAIGHTFILMFLACVFQVGLGGLLAILVEKINIGSKFFKTAFFFPIVISGTAIGLMYKLFYVYNGGLLNTIMGLLGMEPVVWITEKSAMAAVGVPIIWQYVGFYFIIILTAINRIPKDLYESAYIDGITESKKVIYITLPLIWDVIKVCLILAITGALKVFDLVFVITKGGPLGGSELLGTYMYQKTFIDYRFGYGATIAVLIVILGIIISSIVNRLLKKEEITY